MTLGKDGRLQKLCLSFSFGGENGTNGSHLAVYSEDIAYAWHCMVPHPPSTLPSHRSAGGIGYMSV